jgi:ArsR family transcriptional regulator, arsenate/arsenite/antimonite-responsive transcriptional repressor
MIKASIISIVINIDVYLYRGEVMINYAQVLKVMSEPMRLEIIRLLIQGETCGCTMIDKLPISQPTLSYHLKALKEVGLTTTKKEGNWVKHYVNKELLNELIGFLTKLQESESPSCQF